MTNEQRLEDIRDEMTLLISEYAAELDNEFIATEWTAIIGATKIEWNDGRQVVINIHPGISYTSRLGLLTSAKHDLLHVSESEDD